MSTAIDLTDARHVAVLYSASDELARRLVPLLRPSLDHGGPVVAVVDEPTREQLRRELGDDAGRVEFADPEAVHGVPSFTVAMRWARVSRRARAGRATVVGQHVAGLSACGDTHWARLDIGIDVAVAGLPITVLCPYRTDDEALARVRSTHPRLATAAGSVVSETYRPPAESLRDHPPLPPPDLGAPAAELAFTADELGELRHLVAEVAGGGGITPEHVADLVLAVNELGSNCIEHGPGHGRLRLWTGAGAVTAEVVDDGKADLRFAGMVAPAPSAARGRGLWLASELCDVMQVWSDDDGTVIRLRMDGVRSGAGPSYPSSSRPARG